MPLNEIFTLRTDFYSCCDNGFFIAVYFESLARNIGQYTLSCIVGLNLNMAWTGSLSDISKVKIFMIVEV